ncbi:MAG TPA: translation elongation factor Ts [Anaerolineae bacterium]|nr:translation elongation factor Ts [Caldilineae bacterium]HID34166.1 translation elongation factor Ts [Anaerolineae bacterium]HIQ11973.1 translation elongation factor Ts [Caldilineales bacterium]
MEITTQMVKELRQATGAGVLDCRKALEAANGDFDKAVTLLREKGLAAAAKKASREAKEGLVGYYVHPGAKMAAIVEVNCETDFVARTPEFQQLAKDLAMQVVAARPRWLTPEDVPEDVLEAEKAIYRKQLADQGKPEHIMDRIIEGKLKKFYEETCLMEQDFIKNSDVKIKDLITEHVARLGENIRVRRFARFEVGAEG